MTAITVICFIFPPSASPGSHSRFRKMGHVKPLPVSWFGFGEILPGPPITMLKKAETDRAKHHSITL